MNLRAAAIVLSFVLVQSAVADDAKAPPGNQQPAPASRTSVQAAKSKLTQARERLAQLRAEREAALGAAAEPVELNVDPARRPAWPDDPIRADAAALTKVPSPRPDGPEER